MENFNGIWLRENHLLYQNTMVYWLVNQSKECILHNELSGFFFQRYRRVTILSKCSFGGPGIRQLTTQCWLQMYWFSLFTSVPLLVPIHSVLKAIAVLTQDRRHSCPYKKYSFTVYPILVFPILVYLHCLYQLSMPAQKQTCSKIQNFSVMLAS